MKPKSWVRFTSTIPRKTGRDRNLKVQRIEDRFQNLATKAFLRNLLCITERNLPKPFSDPLGRKGMWTWLAHAPRHSVRVVRMDISGWPVLPRHVRIAFLADLHVGSHTNDVNRLSRLVAVTTELRPDLVCLGGDYVNGMLFGGGRVPPEIFASILSRLEAPLGTFAILGDHDITYGAREISAALQRANIIVLEDQVVSLRFEDQEIALVGVTPDANLLCPLVRQASPHIPLIILAHDPAAFAHLPSEVHLPHLMLSGHTHGGQIQLPLIGPIVNASRAPLSWSYGCVTKNGHHLYVTSGIGTSGIPVRIGIPPEIALLEINGSPVGQSSAVSGT